MVIRYMGKKLPVRGEWEAGRVLGSDLEVVAKRRISPPAKNRIAAVNNLITAFINGAGMFHLGGSELRGSRRC
jgi:hypothetical protein